MIQKTTRRFFVAAFAFATLFTSSFAWAVDAPVPVAVWDGDFGTTVKGSYTLNLNGNTAEANGSYITITGNNGVYISGGSLTHSTVLIRYSNLDWSGAASGKAISLLTHKNTAKTEDNCTGVAVDSAGKLNGVWLNDNWGNAGTTALTTPTSADQILGLACTFVTDGAVSNPKEGTWAFTQNQDGTYTKIYDQGGLRGTATGKVTTDWSIGGHYGSSTGNNIITSAQGMKIHSIAIFDSRLDETQLGEFMWPSDVDELYRPFLANFANRIMTITSTGNADAGVDLGGVATFALFDPYAGADTTTTFKGQDATTNLPGYIGQNKTRAWWGFASNQGGYSAPGLVMRFPTYVTGRSITVGRMFAPFTVGGLIVEEGASSGATIPSWTQGSGNRYTELGDKRTSGGVPTLFVLRDSFKIACGNNTATDAGVQLYGDITFDIASDKYFDCNTSRSSGKIELKDGAIFRMVGDGEFKVNTLTATGLVTLDYSAQSLSRATPFIDGNLTIDGDTAFILPAELKADTPFVLCSRTLTGFAEASGLRRIVTIGEEKMFADLTFTENGEVTYTNAIPYDYNAWQGGNGGLWNEPSNWSYGTVPSAEEIVRIATGESAEAFSINFEDADISILSALITGSATSFEFADGTVTLGALNSEVDIFVDADDTLIFPNRKESITLATNKAIKGSGRVVMVGHGITGASDLLDTAAFPGCKDAANWTGTLEVRNWHGEADANHSKFGDDLGNINSVICLNGFKGYVYAKDFAQVKAYEIGANGVEFVGKFSSGNIGFIGDLIGSGDLKLSLSGNTAKNGYLRFVGDSSAYTGSFSFAENNAFPISLIPSTDTTMPLAEFSQRMIILAVEAGAWTVNGDVEVIAGASFDTTKEPTVNGKIKFDSNFVVKTTETPGADGVLFINDTQLTPGTISALSVTVKVGEDVQAGSYHPVTTADGVVAKIVDVAEWSGEVEITEEKSIGAALVVGDCTVKGMSAGLKVTLGSIAINDGMSLTLDNITVEVNEINVLPQAIKLVNGARLIVNDTMTMVQLAADATLEMEAGTQYSIYNVPEFKSGATLKITNASSLKPGNYLLMDWSNWPNPDAMGYGLPQLNVEGYTGAEGSIRLIPEVYKLWLQVRSAEEMERPALTIEPIGDSITEGLNNASGSGKNYRIPLINKLLLAGYNVKSVGYWNRSANNGVTGAYDPSGALITNPDWIYHSGKGSARAGAVSGGNARVRDAWANDIDVGGAPDIVLLHIGINDMLNNGSYNDGDGTKTYQYLTNIVTGILRDRPDVKLVMSSPMANAHGHSQQTATYPDEPGKNDKNNQFCKPLHEMCLEFYNAVKAGTLLTEIPGAQDRLFFADQFLAVEPSWYDDSKLYLNDGSDHCHPNWLGHDLMAETWLEQIKAAFPDPMDKAGEFHSQRTEKGTYADKDLGAMNNVPAAYLNGFKLARQFNTSFTGSEQMTPGTALAYDFTNEKLPDETEIEKVGYYIEYVRETSTTNLHRFVWVDMDAFGTVGEVGIPTMGKHQQVVDKLHVYGNHPAVFNIAAENDTEKGFIEFTPYTYDNNSTPAIEGAPAHFAPFDWHDHLAETGAHGCMQVHRILNPADQLRPAQVVFAYNAFTANGANDQNTVLGIGNFSQSFQSSSTDWTYLHQTETCNASVYTIRNIEIWVKPVAGGKIIPEEQGTVEVIGVGEDAVAVITPKEGVTKIDVTLPAGFAGKYEIPVSVIQITGVEINQLIIKSGDFDIASACKIDDNDNIVLDAIKSVVVDDETIPVTPTFTASDDEVKPLVVSTDETVVGVKAIPGLIYELIRSTIFGGDQTTVASEKATTSRVTLTDSFTEATGGKPASAFYVIQVKK